MTILNDKYQILLDIRYVRMAKGFLLGPLSASCADRAETIRWPPNVTRRTFGFFAVFFRCRGLARNETYDLISERNTYHLQPDLSYG